MINVHTHTHMHTQSAHRKFSDMIYAFELIDFSCVIDTVLYLIFAKVIKSSLIVRLYRLGETFFKLSESL